MLIKQWLQQQAEQPKTHMRRFIIALLLFMVAVACIFIGIDFSHWWQIIGLLLLVPAVLLAIISYIGLLIYRINQFYPPK